jgi:hypothetical protein
VSYPFSVGAVDAAGRLYRYRAAGLSQIGGELWVYDPAGKLDESFASGGRLSVQPGNAISLNGAAITPDGRLLVLGSGGNTNLWMARFIL